MLAAIYLVAVITSSLSLAAVVALENPSRRSMRCCPRRNHLVLPEILTTSILALPFVILIGLIVSRQWKLLGAYATAGLMAVLPCRSAVAASRHPDGAGADRLATLLAQFLDDPRWIAMLAAVLTVSGPWLPRALAALVVGAVGTRADPSGCQRDCAGPLIVGAGGWWLVGALVVLVVGTPARKCLHWMVPFARWPNADSRCVGLAVVRPAGRATGTVGRLRAAQRRGVQRALIGLYGPHQSGGSAAQLWLKLTLRGTETASLQASMRRAVEHRADGCWPSAI